MTPAKPASEATSAGLIRSASLLRALGTQATDVWAALSPEDAALLSATLDALPEDQASTNDAVEAFLREPKPHPSTNPGIWTQLSALPAATLAKMLDGEHPQVVALILARIDPAAAADVVRHVPSIFAMDVLQRMLQSVQPHQSAIRAIETAFAERLAALPKGQANAGGEATVARIFDELDPAASSTLLAALQTTEPGAGERIRKMMFTFADLATLSPAGMQTLLSKTERSTLTLALKGVSGEIETAFFRNITERAGEALREEMATRGPVRRSEVEAARGKMVATARELIASGDIRAGASPDEDLIE